MQKLFEARFDGCLYNPSAWEPDDCHWLKTSLGYMVRIGFHVAFHGYKTEREPDVVVHSCRLSTLEAEDYPVLLAGLVYTVVVQASQDYIVRPHLK